MTDKEIFPNLYSAMEYLQNSGYAIKKSKFYGDKKAGLIRMEADGRRVSKTEIHAYVVKAGLLQERQADQSELEVRAAQKAAAELRKIEEQTRAIRLDREIKEGKYILRDEAILQRIDQLVVLETRIRQLIDIRMPSWCRMLTGDQAKINEAKQAGQADIDEMFNSLAKSETFGIRYRSDA